MKKDDNFNPMNIDDPVFIKQGLDYLNKVKQDLKKGIIKGKVIGKTIIRTTTSALQE